jgi:hypothetical protein
MSMPDPRLTEIENLIQDYRAADKDMTEANVEAAFVARLFAANLSRIAQLMADFRTQCPPEGLHLSELERTLRETDAEIDRRVYDLYELTEEERQIVEESVK